MTSSSSRVQIGPKTLRNRFYAVPHCTGLRDGEARLPGVVPRHEGRGRLGGGLHRVRARLVRTPTSAPYVSARLWDDDDLANLAVMCERVHEHGALAGHRADPHGRRTRSNRQSRLPVGRARPSSRATTSRTSCPRRWSSPTSRASARTGCARPSASRDGRVRHRLRLRRPQLPAAPVPLAVLQPAHRRVRRLASRTARASGSRRSRPCARRSATTAPSPCARASRRSARPESSSTRGSSSSALADHLVDLWDVNVGSIAEWSKDSGAVPLLQGGLPARVDRPRARGDGEADRRRRRG